MLAMLGSELLGLFFPPLCVGCQGLLTRQEQQLCNDCLTLFPQTDYHLRAKNELLYRFQGRAPIYRAAALFRFTKQQALRHLLHQSKYFNRPAVLQQLGRYYGGKLAQASGYGNHVEAIVPVPLHPRRLRQRGYNQSAVFGRGLSQALGVPLRQGWLQRAHYTVSQTKKNRQERFKNVQEVFQVPTDAPVQGAQLLLVDDLITTGATLQACADTLAAAGVSSISLAAVACGMRG